MRRIWLAVMLLLPVLAVAQTVHRGPVHAVRPWSPAVGPLTRKAAVIPPTPPPVMASCDGSALRSTGTIYYFCDCQAGAASGCVAGDDSRTGTSSSLPRRTLNAAFSQFNYLNAGDTVALCRGGAWNENDLGALANANCSGASESTYCDFRDYAPTWGAGAANPRPLLDTVIGDPVPAMFTIWNTDANYQGYRFWNLDIRLHNRTEGGPLAFEAIGKISYLDICNVNMQGGSIGVQAEGYSSGTLNVHNTLRNSTIKNFAYHGFLGGGDYFTLDSNFFYNNGDQSLVANAGWPHTVYFIKGGDSGNSNPMVGARITNNYIHTGPAGEVYDGQTYGSCGGVMMILREGQDGTVVENNYVEGYGAYGCGGIFSSSSGSAAQFHNLLFRRNRVVWKGNVGAPAALLGLNCAQNSVVADNIVESAAASTSAIQSPENADSGCVIPAQANIFRNNSVRLTNGGTGFLLPGASMIVENNAAWVPSGSTCFNVSSADAGHPMTQTNYPSTATNTSGNYCVATGAAATTIWTDPANGNYRPAGSGPLVGTGNSTYYGPTYIGTTTWSASDTGTTATPPIDIGAMLH